MAQNTNTTSIGCASGIVRGLGILLLLAGLGNAFSGEGVPSFVVAIIGLVLLLAGSGKKQRRKENHEALQQARQLYREPILQAKREVKEAVRMAENSAQERAQQRQPQRRRQHRRKPTSHAPIRNPIAIMNCPASPYTMGRGSLKTAKRSIKRDC